MHDMTLESRIQYKNNNRLPVIHFFKDMVLEATVANSKQITSTRSKQKQRRLTITGKSCVVASFTEGRAYVGVDCDWTAVYWRGGTAERRSRDQTPTQPAMHGRPARLLY